MPGVQGGVERHCEALYPLLAGHNGVTVRVYRRKPYLTPDSRDARFDGISFVDLPSTRVRGLEAVLHTLLATVHIAFHRPSVVHVHNMGPAFVAPLLRLLRLPVVMTYHSVNYEHKKWGPIGRALLHLSERVALRCCNRIIFVSRARFDAMPQWVKNKSTYIPNGVDEPHLNVGTDFLLRHGIHPGQYVLAVGRLAPEKGFDHLIKAAQRCHALSQLVIAGADDHSGDYRRRLEALDSAGKTIFTGYTTGDNLAALYRHARLFVLPSLSEGAPLVLLEAMSYSLPILASDIPATRQLPLATANLFRPADVDSLTDALTRTLATPQHPTHYDLTPYNWNTIATATLSQLHPSPCKP